MNTDLEFFLPLTSHCICEFIDYKLLQGIFAVEREKIICRSTDVLLRCKFINSFGHEKVKRAILILLQRILKEMLRSKQERRRERNKKERKFIQQINEQILNE